MTDKHVAQETTRAFEGPEHCPICGAVMMYETVTKGGYEGYPEEDHEVLRCPNDCLPAVEPYDA